eukprot:CAMPEP_0174969556 /NCGR_PEP_ID=MMETSP0004_2-20121128/8834_1 /TAXON_ID=420556 /ORGANISM="Ochromonas sp., Strain CCMP1393" /LENGTH=349 /DNA_ID=CAMNT_0016219071 /DNA_START=117 /DNA_END=1166 /DNA_ORIENTATION=-
MSRNDQFAQFFEEHENVQTPGRRSSRVINTPTSSQTGGGRLSAADFEKTAVHMSPRMEILLKKERKAREEAAQLTFQPHVNHPHKKAPPKAVQSHTQQNRFDALYSDALKRHLETKWKESADVTKELTFQPKITSRGHSRAGSRATSRAGSRAGSRASSPGTPERTSAVDNPGDRLHSHSKGKLKHGPDPDKQLTFSPQITSRAKSIDRKESAKRLYQSNSIQKEKAKAAQREMEQRERELENCTFAPQTNKPNRFTPKTNEDIRDRMSKYEEMKQKRLREAQRAKVRDELADVTFKPALEAKPTRGATPTKPFSERLAQPFDRSIPDSVAAELNATMTFKPTLVSKPS